MRGGSICSNESLKWRLSALVAAVREAGIRLQIKQDIDPRIIQVVRRIDELSCADHVDIDQMAETVDMSAVHLTRLFKEQLNITPVAYHNGVRIEEAKRHLHVPDARIKEVAIDLGFTHLSHFSRWFKQHAGLPPREFLKTVHQGSGAATKQQAAGVSIH